MTLADLLVTFVHEGGSSGTLGVALDALCVFEGQNREAGLSPEESWERSKPLVKGMINYWLEKDKGLRADQEVESL